MRQYKVTQEELKKFVSEKSMFTDNRLGILKSIILVNHNTSDITAMTQDANTIGMHIRMYYFDCVDRAKRCLCDSFEWNDGVFEIDSNDRLYEDNAWDEISETLTNLIVLAFLPTPDPFSNDTNEHDRYYNKLEMLDNYLDELYEIARKDANEQFCKFFKDNEINEDEEV